MVLPARMGRSESNEQFVIIISLPYFITYLCDNQQPGRETFFLRLFLADTIFSVFRLILLTGACPGTADPPSDPPALALAPAVRRRRMFIYKTQVSQGFSKDFFININD